jgi:hypothetical protein
VRDPETLRAQLAHVRLKLAAAQKRLAIADDLLAGYGWSWLDGDYAQGLEPFVAELRKHAASLPETVQKALRTATFVPERAEPGA